MMDTLDTFTTVRDGDVILRMHKDEAPVLQEYALALAHQALTTLAARYEFTPRGPILIEIFPKHDDFAVRNVGLPGMIGALGACFGRVVTMDSPKARPPGKFQWEATLWHELAHVITLQMSNQRVPRWLTEGISVYEEKRARPEWARQMDMQFAEMLKRGETLKLRDPERRVHRPEDDLARLLSRRRCSSSTSSRRTATPGCASCVRAYGQGLDTDAALKTALNTDFDQLQVGFDQIARSRVRQPAPRAGRPPGRGDARRSCRCRRAARVRGAENPRSYPVQMALGRALLKNGAGELDEAMQAFERAAALVPIARATTARTRRWRRSPSRRRIAARAIAELQALVAVDFDNVEAARQLASLMHEAGIDDPAKLGAGVSAHRRDRSVRRRRAPRARALRDAAQRAGRRGARVPRRAGARAGRSRRRRTPIWRRAISRAASAPRRRSRRSPRSRSRRPTSARRTCC